MNELRYPLEMELGHWIWAFGGKLDFEMLYYSLWITGEGSFHLLPLMTKH